MTINTRQKAERTTLVLPIVGIDIGAIDSGNSVVLRLGPRQIKSNFSSFYLTLSKRQAAVSGGRIKNAPPSAMPARCLQAYGRHYIF